MEKKEFLPYQKRWLNDNSKIKIWEKSRRIGATYVQAFEDVIDCVEGNVPAVWFSSADESAAREYIYYCAEWAQYIGQMGIDIIESDRDIKSFSITFLNGTRINAMSSNPKGFRSKGGKVILDEFAWHSDQDSLWAAAKPVITWGFPLRILSTHNGKSCKYYKFVDSVKKNKLKWSHHLTDVITAVDEGLVDKIFQREVTQEDKNNWLLDLQESCFDSDVWDQEYLCRAVDSTTAFIPYEMIESCEKDTLESIGNIKGDLYIGVDIGRKRDLSVIWGIEKLKSGKLLTRFVNVLEKMPFKSQYKIISEIMDYKNVRKLCIDCGGLGMQLAEEIEEKYGNKRVDQVSFTLNSKSDMAYGLKTHMENQNITIPINPKIREDFHAVQKIITSAANTKFEGQNDNSHCDYFWAAALAVKAVPKHDIKLEVITRKDRKYGNFTRGYR